MILYIKVIDGQPVGNPALEDNLLAAFPEGIPSEFEPFTRIQDPTKPTFNQKSVVSYLKNEAGVWYDSWSIVDLTAEELAEKTAEATAQINNELERRKKRCMDAIAYCLAMSDLNGTNLWENSLNEHNNWELKSVSPFAPMFPFFPALNIQTKEWTMLPDSLPF
jgi:hypothetical protein